MYVHARTFALTCELVGVHAHALLFHYQSDSRSLFYDWSAVSLSDSCLSLGHFLPSGPSQYAMQQSLCCVRKLVMVNRVGKECFLFLLCSSSSPLVTWSLVFSGFSSSILNPKFPHKMKYVYLHVYILWKWRNCDLLMQFCLQTLKLSICSCIVDTKRF